MKIALVGYGKMGRMIEVEAKKKGFSISATIDSYAKDASHFISTPDELQNALRETKPDVIIEFTHPEAVLENISAILPLGIPLVVGTTGWLSKLDEVKNLVKKNQSTLFYAANFSIGVNLFYKVVSEAAKTFASYEDYDVALWEAHHKQKADSPSGTALELAKKVMENYPRKNEMVFDAFHTKPEDNQLHVSSTRYGFEPGTHKVFFDSNADTIELIHRARSREGFALGAVHAASWIFESLVSGKIQKGSVYSMDDMLS